MRYWEDLEIDELTCPLLGEINSPEDIRRLNAKQLSDLADELRAFLIYHLSRSGGHFASGLGVVELTLALYYTLDWAHDNVLWDTGHQCYPHKILTGRRDLLPTIRQKGGLAPFLERTESPFDLFGAGHVGDTLSGALAIAMAANQRGDTQARTVCVMGDSGLNAGVVFEALNHAGFVKPKGLTLIVNDNQMSISENIGALGLCAQNPDDFRSFFESLGWHYRGCYDGHNLPHLIACFETLNPQDDLQVIHLKTTKGKGFLPAERDPVAYHFLAPQRKKDSNAPIKKASISASACFGVWLEKKGAEDERLYALTPAMKEGSCMKAFAQDFPKRFIDVGIAEQHAMATTAGLAIAGEKPVLAIYSTFLQRAYDQLIQGVAIQHLDVLFVIDRSGIVGGDGATHQGVFDISFVRPLPGVCLLLPAFQEDIAAMMDWGYTEAAPVFVRLPRGALMSHEAIDLPLIPVVEKGKGLILRRGKTVAFLGFGKGVLLAKEAALALDATWVDMRFIKPIDEALIEDLAKTHDLLVTIEDHIISGGAGSAVLEYMSDKGIVKPLLRLGIDEQWVKHGEFDEICEGWLDTDSILLAVKEKMKALKIKGD